MYAITINGNSTYNANGQDILIHYGSGDYVLLKNGRTGSYDFDFGSTGILSLSTFFARAFEYRQYGNTNNNVAGTEHEDRIHTGSRSDTIATSGGNDKVYAGNGRDSIALGNGDDLAYGGLGQDWIHGGHLSSLAY